MPIEKVHAFTAQGPDLGAELTRRVKAAWFDTGGTVSSTETSGPTGFSIQCQFFQFFGLRVILNHPSVAIGPH